MINYEYSSLFQETSIKRQLFITSAAKNLTITNEELYEDDFELSEGICSGEQLVFGSFESARIKFKASGISTSLKGQWLDVSMVLGGNSSNPFRFGSFKVDSDKPSADRRKREYVAYDVLHDVIGADVAHWYQGLEFPLTMREFRDSFFGYFSIAQEELELVNDGMVVEKTINPESISGKDVLSAILEINGCFGHINRNGNFRYVYLKRLDIGAPLSDTLYPSITLYPSEELFPRELNEIVLNEARYFDCTYEDFVTQKVTQLQIRKDEDDIGCIAGTEGNLYIIEDNFLVYGKSSEELEEIAEKILEKIEEASYIPCSVTAKGNPCMEPGEGFRLCTKYQTVDSYMLSRTLKGVQNLMDTYTAEGVEYYEQDLNSTARDIKELKGKTNKLIRTVDETRLEMEDIEQGLWSEIVLTASQLQTRITNAEMELASSITQTAEDIRMEVSDTANAIRSRITQTASSIRSEVSDTARTLQSRITQTATSIRAEVSDTANALQSSITQTAEEIALEVTRATTEEERLSSSIIQNADSILAEVRRAREAEEELSASIQINADKIALKVGSSTVQSMIDLSLEELVLSASQINLEGYTTINGGFSVDTSGNAVLSNGYYYTKLESNGLSVVYDCPGYDGIYKTTLKDAVISLTDPWDTIVFANMVNGRLYARCYSLEINGYDAIHTGNINAYVDAGTVLSEALTSDIEADTNSSGNIKFNGKTAVSTTYFSTKIGYLEDDIYDLKSRIVELEDLLSGGRFVYLQMENYDGDEEARYWFVK